MQRGICFKNQAKAIMTMFVLMAIFVGGVGCSSSQQSAGEGENALESYTSTASTPSTQQTSTQGNQGQVLPERYDGLKMGEAAEFKNGLTVTLEGASVIDVPGSLSDSVDANDVLVAVRFNIENTNPEGQMPLRLFRISTAQWEAIDQNSNPLQTLYSSETSLIAGELPNPTPNYPYMGWQGELRPEQQRQGSMLFAALPSTRMRVRFTQPVMNPPLGEWELGTISELLQAP
jgi:hypothetical protein